MGFVRVGKVKDAHGIRGELFVVLFAGEAAWLPKLKELRLVRDTAASAVKSSVASSTAGEAQVFAVKSARAHKNGLIVKSGDISDRNMAETLKGLLVEIPDDYLVSAVGEAIYLREVQGFLLRNRGADVGRIEKFASNTVQDLLVVATPSGEFEIPFVDAFIKKIDYPARIVDMDLPVGLLGEDVGDERDGLSDDKAEE